ncbi:MAG TPA: hypothetical protein VIF14_15995 [Alphaproteobacteria bacterium]|jgi:hypothetical protein
MFPLPRSLTPLFVAAIVGTASAWGAPPAAAQAKAIQSQDTNIDGVVAEITQAQRKEGVLTVRLRVRNTSPDAKTVGFPWGLDEYDKFYVTAGKKKYLILRDSAKVPIASPPTGSKELAKGASFIWWAKFPAPAAGDSKFSFYTSIAPPFEDVPISD